MAEQFYTILTKVGKAKIANNTALGTRLNLVKFQLGDGGGSYYNPTEDQEQLKNKVWEGNISSIAVDKDNPNWIVIETLLPGDIGGFMIREAGVFDNENNLIAIGKYPETYKPVVGDGSTKDLVIKMILEVSNTSSVTLKVDATTILATKKDIENVEKKIDIKLKTVDTTVEKLQNEIKQDLGDRNDLKTSNKDNLVSAINETFQRGVEAKQNVVTALTSKKLNVTTENTWDEISDKIKCIKLGDYSKGDLVKEIDFEYDIQKVLEFARIDIASDYNIKRIYYIQNKYYLISSKYIYILDDQGKMIANIYVENTLYNSKIDAQGNIYYIRNSFLKKIDSNGNDIFQLNYNDEIFKTDNKSEFRSIAVTPNGNRIFIIKSYNDSNNNSSQSIYVTIYALSADGNEIISKYDLNANYDISLLGTNNYYVFLKSYYSLKAISLDLDQEWKTVGEYPNSTFPNLEHDNNYSEFFLTQSSYMNNKMHINIEQINSYGYIPSYKVSLASDNSSFIAKNDIYYFVEKNNCILGEENTKKNYALNVNIKSLIKDKTIEGLFQRKEEIALLLFDNNKKNGEIVCITRKNKILQ